MTVLIAVASRHGSTKDIAEVIASELGKEGIRVAGKQRRFGRRSRSLRSCDPWERGLHGTVVTGSATIRGSTPGKAACEAGMAILQRSNWRAPRAGCGFYGPRSDRGGFGAKGSRTFAGRLRPDERVERTNCGQVSLERRLVTSESGTKSATGLERSLPR